MFRWTDNSPKIFTNWLTGNVTTENAFGEESCTEIYTDNRKGEYKSNCQSAFCPM